MREPAGRMHGYARVSTDEQNLDMQIEALLRAGVQREHIYEDRKSGKNLKRGGLQDVLAMMRKGDVLVVWRFDRLSRSLRDLLQVFDELQERGIQLRSLHEQLDTTTPMGRLMFQLSGVLSEFERGLIAQRTAAGMGTAKRNGRRFGPPRKLDPMKIKAAMRMLRDGAPVADVAKKLHVGCTTLRNRVMEANKGKRLWRVGPRARQ